MTTTSPLKQWFFERIGDTSHKSHQQDNWWNVMCLTGVDYFSSLGFAPGMAFLYAGILSPFATLLLVALNLFGALPMYAKVAELSPNGQGSVSLLQDLLPSWWGKFLVICLLGFAATGFMMTITLCSSDAAKHIVDNPWAPDWLQNQLCLTLLLVALLGVVFLKGFKDAIWLAVILVWTYLALTMAVIGKSVIEITHHLSLLYDWSSGLYKAYPSVWQIVLVSIFAFPKLALGMSGFETGVAVMPHVKGDNTDSGTHPKGRIRNTKFLLLTAALIMSFFLLASSLVTTMLIPHEEFGPEGKANGRALAYLAHMLLGDTFGTIYDISTVFILWFAGASAMAGLLNLIPRYLPRYGMAPEWVSSLRPLVLLLTAIGFAVVIHFNADVDDQAGAFATGLLVFMTSAAFAAMLSTWKTSRKQAYFFLLTTMVFTYTTSNIIISRPDGIKIAGFFILCMTVSSLLSRCLRSTELRVKQVMLNDQAKEFLDQVRQEHPGKILLLANRPGNNNYQQKEEEARELHSLQTEEGNFIFLEVSPTDPSNFVDDSLTITGHEHDGHRIWRCSSTSVPNAIAALLLHLRDTTGEIPHVYFGWTEGHPLNYVLKYVLWGEGETAPVTREILRSAVPDPAKRPRVHVS